MRNVAIPAYVKTEIADRQARFAGVDVSSRIDAAVAAAYRAGYSDGYPAGFSECAALMGKKGKGAKKDG